MTGGQSVTKLFNQSFFGCLQVIGESVSQHQWHRMMCKENSQKILLHMSGIAQVWCCRRIVKQWCLIERNTCMLTVPFYPGLDTITPNLLSGRLVCYAAVSIPYFYSAHPQRALPFKEGGSYSQLCLSIPRWPFKRTGWEREKETAAFSLTGASSAFTCLALVPAVSL